MGGDGEHDALLRRARSLFDTWAQAQATSAEVQVRLEQLRFELQLRNGSISAAQDQFIDELILRVETRDVLRSSKPHEIAPEVRANLTWQPDRRGPEGGPLKLRRVNEKNKFPLKATFGELIAEFWSKVERQLTLEQRATLKPKLLFDRIALDRGFDTRTLWRAWDTFVLDSERKELPMPLPADWARQPPNADRFESHRIGPTWAVISMDPYAAELVGIDPLDLVGHQTEEAGLHSELLSIDVEHLERLLGTEEEVWVVARETAKRSVLLLATMERLGLDGYWRIMWQVLHERELGSALEEVQRLNHHRRTSASRQRLGDATSYCRDSSGDCHDSSAADGNYCRDSAGEVTVAQAGRRVTTRIAAGRRVA